ncbi:Phosphoribosylglycinamide formyltransferase [Streptomyces sp. MH60]|nr:Phosphoribosylglycinamide formyltransferase [Streptomyces sp. MH60]
MPVSLLTVGRFVDFPVSRGAKHSYDRTNRSASPRKAPTVAATPVDRRAKRLVVLVSGSGTNLQALLDEIAATGAETYGAEIVAVGADRDGIEGLARAERAGVATFVCRVKDHGTREEWDAALAEAVAAHEPDLVVSAGFMKIVGKEFLARFGGRFVNTHPALLPSFPGAHGVRDALAYGARVTGCTVHFVDDGVDTGPIIAQGVVEVRDEDYEDEGVALHERIKEVERRLLVDVVGRLARNGYRIEGRKVVIQ